MAYLQFKKHELGNLEYALNREILAVNRAGGYLNTTLTGCNTRRYHGLMVLPVEELGGENHVLLSSLDETLIQHDQAFNLGIHRYPGIYEPRGHKYIVDFQMNEIAVITYRIGGMVFKKELLFLHNKEQLLIRYTLVEAGSPTILRLKPFLAFRNIHDLTYENMAADTFHTVVEKGVGYRLYGEFPRVYMQLNVQHEFVKYPQWYKNIEYLKEKERGYGYREDLFVPGYFECPIKKGQAVIFSASLAVASPGRLQSIFNKELEGRSERDTYKECLKIAASQFLVNRNNVIQVKEGYPWLDVSLRNTAIALPGLTCFAKDREALFARGLAALTENEKKLYYTPDTPLWLFWTLQQYLELTGDKAGLWTSYGRLMKSILGNYKKGTDKVQMHPNGLLWTGEDDKLGATRYGYLVEVCALWYNAVCFALELARDSNERGFVAEYENLPDLIKENFLPTFWCEARSHLADFVNHEEQNIFTRPNQIFACSLPFTPLADETINSVLAACSRELLTSRGLRTLSPKNHLYEGRCEGSSEKRSKAYLNGSVWPWLLGHFLDAQFRLHGRSFVASAKDIIGVFEEEMTEHGIGSIAELYDGDPPHKPHGCIASARSVAGILRAMKRIEKFDEP
ncbi:MAG: amylo-alpha-1,6-glucosidase [Bacteroidales bacterium]|jgi:predicted glycogen debranching enzyme|nr:glycogen debranching enzyme N-terminal domain-containing protein [Bacteroidales bacterium]NLK79252.1 amylo-alpha-1,6-glucosidase [Bacteroidales bacterium]HKM31925.1 glycogen debranching enzyme N-terminal domain-containing protein [Bacteroidales bacterium]